MVSPRDSPPQWNGFSFNVELFIKDSAIPNCTNDIMLLLSLYRLFVFVLYNRICMTALTTALVCIIKATWRIKGPKFWYWPSWHTKISIIQANWTLWIQVFHTLWIQVFQVLQIFHKRFLPERWGGFFRAILERQKKFDEGLCELLNSQAFHWCFIST